jgi:DNA-binding transcriptional MerR regulator
MTNPAKFQFTISEVASLVGVPAHVLRYWEKEFAPHLAPEKNLSGQRVYRQKDVDAVLHIKRLLYEDEYTISGAKKRLIQDIKGSRQAQLPLELNLREADLTAHVLKTKRSLAALVEKLARPLDEGGAGG